MQSSTPKFSDHASDSEMETDEEVETKDVEKLSDERDDEHADQLNDDNGNDIPDWAYSSTVPTTNHYSILPIPAATVETTPANAIETGAPNCHPKWVIKPRVQADQATMDDSDCPN